MKISLISEIFYYQLDIVYENHILSS